MKIIPIISYQAQNRNNQKQNINFGAFRLKEEIRTEEDAIRILKVLNDFFMPYGTQIMLHPCFNKVLVFQWEYEKFFKLKGKKQQRFQTEAMNKIKNFSLEDIPFLQKEIDENPKNALKIIYKR